jgi:protein SCO1/2
MSQENSSETRAKGNGRISLKRNHIISIAFVVGVVIGMAIIGPMLMNLNSSNNASTDEWESLEVLGEAPDFTLINQDGQNVSLSDLKGNCILVDFIYTRCPMVEMCPRSTSNFAEVQMYIRDQWDGESKKNVTFISISFDSKYDNPKKLKVYGESFGANFSSWHFLTGDNETIDRVMDGFGVYYAEESDGTFGHTMMAALIDQESRIRKKYYGKIYEIEDVIKDIKQLLN